MKQTAVEWLINYFLEYGYNFGLHKSEIAKAKEMEKQQIGYNNEQMMEYAKFCINCYNQGLPNIMPNDWKNLYKNE